MNNKNIVILGSLTQDLFVYANGNSVITQSDEHGEKSYYAIEHGGKLTAKYLERHLGGGGANVGVSLQRLGFVSHVFGARADDEVGEFIEKNLQREKVNTENIQIVHGGESGFSVILNSYQGERTVIFTSQANKKFVEISASAIEAIDPVALYLCHLSSGSNNTISSELVSYLEKHTETLFAWNPGKERLVLGLEEKSNSELLRHCNILFLNKEEAELLTAEDVEHPHSSLFVPENIPDVSLLAKKILQKGVERVVITDGRNGVQVFSTSESFYVSSLGGERVDTLGAGDSFASAFLASILLGKGLKNAAEFARINAQSVVAHRGAQPGLLIASQLYKNTQ